MIKHAPKRRGAHRIAAAVAIALAFAAPAAGQGIGVEAAVKATYLAKFPAYATWPSAASDQSFAICVVGESSFGRQPEQAAAGQRIEGRPLVVRRLATIEAGAPCQLAFIAGSSRQSVRAALDAVAGAPILTITDAGIGAERGVIHFETSAGRVRFHIDERQAARNGITVSSRLMSLALSVTPREGR